MTSHGLLIELTNLPKPAKFALFKRSFYLYYQVKVWASVPITLSLLSIDYIACYIWSQPLSTIELKLDPLLA